MTELLGRFGSAGLAPSSAKRFFQQSVSVSLDAARTASPTSVVTLTLHLRSAQLAEGYYLHLEELELSAQGQSVPFQWKESHWSSRRTGEDVFFAFHLSALPPDTHVVSLRATASWHRGVMAGALRGRPLKSKYGWLIEESAVIETGQ